MGAVLGLPAMHQRWKSALARRDASTDPGSSLYRIRRVSSLSRSPSVRAIQTPAASHMLMCSSCLCEQYRILTPTEYSSTATATTFGDGSSRNVRNGSCRPVSKLCSGKEFESDPWSYLEWSDRRLRLLLYPAKSKAQPPDVKAEVASMSTVKTLSAHLAGRGSCSSK